MIYVQNIWRLHAQCIKYNLLVFKCAWWLFFCSIYCLFVLLCNGISVVYGPHWIGFASFICINQRTRYYRGTDIHNFPWKYIQIEECIWCERSCIVHKNRIICRWNNWCTYLSNCQSQRDYRMLHLAGDHLLLNCSWDQEALDHLLSQRWFIAVYFW